MKSKRYCSARGAASVIYLHIRHLPFHPASLEISSERVFSGEQTTRIL